MTESRTQFGYCPRPLNINVGDISITTLSDMGDSVARVEESDGIVRDWIYAPLQQKISLVQPRKTLGYQEITRLPYSSRVFSLPKTHELQHKKSSDPDHIEFLIWTLGFFLGIRLTATEAGFLDCTPIKTGRLVDFVPLSATLEEAIQHAEDFWQAHKGDTKTTSRVNGIIHALFLSQRPPILLEFEKFLVLYPALDACYASVKEIECAKEQTHAQRIDWVCKKLNIDTPSWANPTSGKTELSIMRNDLIHEVLFFDKPLGFQAYGGNDAAAEGGMIRRNVPLEVANLVSRILVWLLAGENDYTKTSVDRRQKIGLNLVRRKSSEGHPD